MSIETQNSINSLLRSAVEMGASDLHLREGKLPLYRLHGNLISEDETPVSRTDLEKYAESLTTPEQREKLTRLENVDLSHSFENLVRCRVNIFRQSGGISIVTRLIPIEPPSAEDLKLPEVMSELVKRPSGLVLMTGPTGGGKSTTLAALVNEINQTRRLHILTIEDPIEFMISDNACMITQQEVGQHVRSFAEGLRSALRGDADVIVVGEMRDLDTISNAITAAATGHLVIGTLHTNDSVQAIDRLIDVFPADAQSQIRSQIASCLQGIMYQTLARRTDGVGREALFEVIVLNSGIRNLIKENKISQIYSAMQTGKKEGMMLLNDSIFTLYKEGVISEEEALSKSFQSDDLSKAIARSNMKSFQLSP